MKKRTTSLLFLFCIGTCFGCATQTFMMKENPPVRPYKHTDKMQHFFISGLGQEKTLKPAEMCGGKDKIYKVQTKMTFVNWLLGGLTFGIYTPRQVKVYCIPYNKAQATAGNKAPESN